MTDVFKDGPFVMSVGLLNGSGNNHEQLRKIIFKNLFRSEDLNVSRYNSIFLSVYSC